MVSVNTNGKTVLIISDSHLLNEKAIADRLLVLLKTKFDILILNGDFLDLWKLRFHKLAKSEQEIHLRILEKIFKLSRKGKEIYYVIGNHENILWNLLPEGSELNNIVFCKSLDLIVGDKKYFVTHGQIFDLLIRSEGLLAYIGDFLYETSIKLTKLLNRIRRILRRKPWSLSHFLKVKTKNIVNVINRFENVAIEYCKKHQYDGIILGHIHYPEIRWIGNLHYCNSGCWTDEKTCSFLILENEQIQLGRVTPKGEIQYE